MIPYAAQLVNGECYLRHFLSGQLADGLRSYV